LAGRQTYNGQTYQRQREPDLDNIGVYNNGVAKNVPSCRWASKVPRSTLDIAIYNSNLTIDSTFHKFQNKLFKPRYKSYVSIKNAGTHTKISNYLP
jgi:hypothetical protein